MAESEPTDATGKIVTKRNRVINKVIQHPSTFNSIRALCKHLGEVWEMDLIGSLEAYQSEHQFPPDVGFVAAYIIWSYPLPNDECKRFVFDAWVEAMQSIKTLTSQLHFLLFKRLRTLTQMYYTGDFDIAFLIVERIINAFIPDEETCDQRLREFANGKED